MSQRIGNTLRAGLCVIAVSAATAAQATEGYFVEGVSARDQALGGAGIANPGDALINASNPAGLVDVGHQINGAISLFDPNRGYNASGTMLTAPGHVESGRDIFAIPALGYSVPLDADRAIGVSLSGNGGMNTTYGGGLANANCQGPFAGATGVFCGGRTGVDLTQALISVGYAQRLGKLDLGIAPVMAVQIFSAYGLGAMGAFGLSSNPGELTNHSPSWSVGAGVRAGAIYHFDDRFNIAVAGSTPIWSTPFQNYTGLFAGRGNFDIPGSIGAGLSYKILPTLAVMVDYKHIFYSAVKSVGDPMLPLVSGSQVLGTANGPGFGWSDVDVVSIGVEYQYNDRLTLRAGYSHNTQPISAANVMLNILAPGVVTDHIAGGFTYKVDPRSAVDFSLVYAPKAGVTGQEYFPGAPANAFGPGSPAIPAMYVPGSKINIAMSQLVVTLGYTYHFDTPAPVAVAAKY